MKLVDASPSRQMRKKNLTNFLSIFQARPDDITNLYKEINKRIDLEKSRTPTSSTNDDVTSDSNEKLSVEKLSVEK